METDFVTMTHPDIAVPGGPVSRQAYEDTYRHKGWVVADPPALEVPTAPDVEVTDLDSPVKTPRRSTSAVAPATPSQE